MSGLIFEGGGGVVPGKRILNNQHCVEPDGYLQWVERDWLSKFPKTASAEDAANVQLGAFLNGVMPNRETVSPFPSQILSLTPPHIITCITSSSHHLHRD